MSQKRVHLEEAEHLRLQNIGLKRENLRLMQQQVHQEGLAAIAPIAEKLGVHPSRVQVDLNEQVAWAIEEIKEEAAS